MRINCTLCGYELNLDHQVFDEYEGPVKCFCCSTIMHIKTTQGTLNSINSTSSLPPPSTDTIVRSTLQDQEI